MIHKFEEYPELADLMQEYACNGRFGDWQKFTDALNNALTKAENLPISVVVGRSEQSYCLSENCNGEIKNGECNKCGFNQDFTRQ
jgi:hypothetical protein